MEFVRKGHNDGSGTIIYYSVATFHVYPIHSSTGWLTSEGGVQGEDSNDCDCGDIANCRSCEWKAHAESCKEIPCWCLTSPTYAPLRPDYDARMEHTKKCFVANCWCNYFAYWRQFRPVSDEE
jgi:hypothetical protein